MSINQLHKDITNLLYRVEEDYSKIIQFGDDVPIIELDIVLKDVRLLYEYFNELKYHAENQRRKATPKEKTQETAAVVADEKLSDKAVIISSLLDKETLPTEVETIASEEEITENFPEKEEEIEANLKNEIIEASEIASPLSTEIEIPAEEVEEEASEIGMASSEKEQEETIEEIKTSTEEELTPEAPKAEEKTATEPKAPEKKEEIKAAPIAWQKTFDATQDKNKEKGGIGSSNLPSVAPKVDLLKERERDFVPTVRKIEFKKEHNQPEPKKESIFEKAASLYDKISKPTDKSIAAQHSRQPISNIKSTIGINDKFIYLKELFKGNVEEYGGALDKLNDFDSYAEAEDYFQELKEKYGWDPDTKSFQGLAELLLRRYL